MSDARYEALCVMERARTALREKSRELARTGHFAQSELDLDRAARVYADACVAWILTHDGSEPDIEQRQREQIKSDMPSCVSRVR